MSQFAGLSLEELQKLTAELRAEIKNARIDTRKAKRDEEDAKLSEARAMLVSLVSDWATSYAYAGKLSLVVEKTEAGFVAKLNGSHVSRRASEKRTGHQSAPDKYVVAIDGADASFRTPAELYAVLSLEKPKSVSGHQGLVRLAHNGQAEKLAGVYAVYGAENVLISAIDSF